MQRRFLSLVGTMILAVSGAASAFSQTPTAMVDRARKDLQNIIDAKKDQPNAAHQSALVSLMQVRQSLGAGNEDFAVQQIDSLVTLPGIPEDIRGAIEAIGQRIRTERADRVTAYNTDVDAACQRAAAAVSQAKEPKDLDATLRDLARMSDRPVITRTGENGSGRVPKLQTATSFVTRWQDYLQAKGHSSDNNLSSMLRTLADGNTPPLIPRSEILALMPPPDAEAEPPARFRRPTPTSTPTPMPTAQVDAAATEIMRGVKKLDDVAPAITQLVELRKEAGPYNNAGSDSTLGAALNGLQALQRTALETENGMTSGYGFGLSRSEYPSHPEVETFLLPLRVQLVKQAASRLVAAPSDAKSADGEPLDTYLRRLIASANKRQDWAGVVRGLEFCRTLTGSGSSPFIHNADQELTAFQTFLAAINLEQAAQYEEAVASYLNALRSGQEDLPTALIGERLANIQKAHPAEYARGTGRVDESVRTYRNLRELWLRGRGEAMAPGEDAATSTPAPPTPTPTSSVSPNVRPAPTPTPMPVPSATAAATPTR